MTKPRRKPVDKDVAAQLKAAIERSQPAPIWQEMAKDEDTYIERHRVPTGWIYRVTTLMHGILHAQIVFVPEEPSE